MELSPDEVAILRQLANLKHDPICPNCVLRSVDPLSKNGWCVYCDARRERQLLAKRRWWAEHRGKDRGDST